MTFGDDSARVQAPGPDVDAERGVTTVADGAYPAPGETLRWEGRPTPWRAARDAGFGLVLMLPMLVITGILAWFLLSTGQGANFVATTVFVIGWLVLLPVVTWFKARRLRFLVTDRRLLAITPASPDGEWQLPLGRIDRIERRDHADGTATLTLLAAGLSGNRLVLHGIEQPEAAIKALSAGVKAVDHTGLWPVATLWRADPAAALPSALEPGERLIWAGRPDALASVREIALESAPFAALAVPFAGLLFWILPLHLLFKPDSIPRLAGVVFALGGLVVVGPMLYAAIFVPLASVWRALTSVVAVTDRRVVIAHGFRLVSLRSLFPDDMRSVFTLHTRDDGRASLYLRLRRQSLLPDGDTAFHGVASAAVGEAAIDALLAKSK